MPALKRHEEDAFDVELEGELDRFLHQLTAVANGARCGDDVMCVTSTMKTALAAVVTLRKNYEELYSSAEQWEMPAPAAKAAQLEALDLIEKLDLGYVRGRIVQIMLLLPGAGMQVKAVLIKEAASLVAHLARSVP